MRVSALEATIATLEGAVRAARAGAGPPAEERGRRPARGGGGGGGWRGGAGGVGAPAPPAAPTRHETIRRTRSLRHWTDPDGAFRIDGRLLPEDGAEILAGLEPFRARIFGEARAAGRRERYAAYLADAPVAMARAAPTGSGTPRPLPRAPLHL